MELFRDKVFQCDGLTTGLAIKRLNKIVRAFPVLQKQLKLCSQKCTLQSIVDYPGIYSAFPCLLNFVRFTKKE